MFKTIVPFLALAGMSGVYAQVQIYECDSSVQPDYKSCDKVMAMLDWNSGNEGQVVADGACNEYYEGGNVGNCRIYACNVRGDGAGAPLNVFNGPTFYGLIKQWCEADLSGGSAPVGGGTPTYIQTANNRDWNPPSAAKRAAFGKLVVETLTVEEANAKIGMAKNANSARLDKRAPTWTNFGTSKGIRDINKRDLMVRGGSGTSTAWSNSEGYSSSVTTSAEMGVNFEIFTASMSLEVTEETSYEWTETVTFDPSTVCGPGQRSAVYFYPLFDKYKGKFSDSDTVYDIWVPLQGQYEWDTECLGSA